MRRPPILLRCALGLSFCLVACEGATVTTSPLPALSAVPSESVAKAKISPLILANGSGTNDGGVQETLHVVVAGGPRAGTYDKSTTTGGCSYGLAGADSFGNQYTDTEEKSGLSSLQMVVPSTKEATVGTARFNVSFGFGDIQSDSATNYEVEGRGDTPARGKGTVTVDDQGKIAQILLHAEPAVGIKVDAVIDCKAVLRVKR